MSNEQQQQPQRGSTSGKESSRRLLEDRLSDVPGQRALPARLVSAIKVCAPPCIVTPAQVHVFTAHTALTCILLRLCVFTALTWVLPPLNVFMALTCVLLLLYVFIALHRCYDPEAPAVCSLQGLIGALVHATLLLLLASW